MSVLYGRERSALLLLALCSLRGALFCYLKTECAAAVFSRGLFIRHLMVGQVTTHLLNVL